MSVTATSVKLIFDTSLTDAQVEAFIATAQAIFDANLDGEGYSTATEEQIVTWLTAHLASARDQRAASEAIGSASKSFRGTTGLGLDYTFYGQNVKMLDTSGKLDNLGKSRCFVQVGYEVPDA